MTPSEPSGLEDCYRVLDVDGRPVGDVPDVSDDRLVSMYRDMRLARRFDERAVSLQRQGRMGTYAPLAGQEAAQIGSTYALDDADWLVYQYREHGTVAVRGSPSELGDYLAYWMGHEAGNAALLDLGIAPLNISIASQLPHAVGMSWASKLQGERRVFVVHFGDGATSEGDFHEAMNVAGVFDTPTVFLCHNNGWAISVPRERQTASATLAGKAEAYGLEGVRVDGMDPLAVYEVTRDAARKARAPGDGQPRPTLIEAVSYRFGAHTTSDDPGRYRDADEVARWRERDPLPRFEAFLRETGRLDDDREEAVREDVEATVAAAVETAEAHEADPDDMFAYAYADLPPEVARQREAFGEMLAEYGDESFLREE